MATTPSESSEVESPSGKTLNQSEDNSNSPLVIVVGIAGGTCSGKSTLANYLVQKFTHTIDIHQDDFYLDDDLVPRSPGGKTGLWDEAVPAVVESLDAVKLLQSVQSIIKQPQDFCKACTAGKGEQRTTGGNHATVVTTLSLSSSDAPSPSPSPSPISPTSCPVARHLVIIEGTMILNISELRSLLQAAFFITVSYETSYKRRSCRNYGPLPDPSGYYDNHVWPAYLRDKKVAESLINPPVHMLDGGKPLKELQSEVEAEVEKFLLNQDQ